MEYVADIEYMRVFASLKKYTDRELLYHEPVNSLRVPNTDSTLYDFWESEINIAQEQIYRHVDCHTDIHDIVCENDSSYTINWEAVLPNITNLSKVKMDNESTYPIAAQQYHEVICGIADALMTASTIND
jgi:hypothetical protein